MNLPSVLVLVVVLALCGLALWRVYRKGAPCEGGCAGGCRGCARACGRVARR